LFWIKVFGSWISFGYQVKVTKPTVLCLQDGGGPTAVWVSYLQLMSKAE